MIMDAGDRGVHVVSIGEYANEIWKYNRTPKYCVVPAIERTKNESDIHHVALYANSDSIFFFGERECIFLGAGYPGPGNNLCLEKKGNMGYFVDGIRKLMKRRNKEIDFERLEKDLANIGDLERTLRHNVGEYRVVPFIVVKAGGRR